MPIRRDRRGRFAFGGGRKVKGSAKRKALAAFIKTARRAKRNTPAKWQPKSISNSKVSGRAGYKRLAKQWMAMRTKVGRAKRTSRASRAAFFRGARPGG